MKKPTRSQMLVIGLLAALPMIFAIDPLSSFWAANISETAQVSAVSDSTAPATRVRAPNSCQHQGKTYRDGQSFKIDCNYCGCSNGQVACTMMACGGIPTPKPTCTPRPACLDAQPACMLAEPKEGWCVKTSPKPSVSPAGKMCEFKGKTFKDGEGFKDDCNACSCVDGQVACTMMACHSSPLPTPNSCTHKGKTYKDGERFKDECNSCACANGQVRCTEMACGSSPSPHPSCEPRPTCPPDQPNCSLPPAPPRWGWCPTVSPKPTCTPRPACLDAQPACMLAEPKEGWCVKTSPKPSVSPAGKMCEFKGKTYKDGKQFRDECNACGCANGQVACTKMECKSSPLPPPNSCAYKGKIYKEGEGFKDDCNSCGCANGQVACTMMACNGSPAPTTTAIPPLPGDPMVNDCSLLNAKNPVRPGVGAPFNPFSSDKRLIMRSECAADGFKAKIEGSTQDGKSVAAFRYGFKWNGKTWERFEFISNASGGTETNTASEFLAQPLVSKDTLAYTGDTTYWLAYTCTYKNKLWKCGCADDTCSRSHWNMQGAVRQPIPVE